jgi:uncharacterized GH25 family protein
MTRFLLGSALVATLALPAAAHEIKVFASQQAIPEPGVKSTVFLSWGHRVPVDDLIDSTALDRYDLVAPDGTATALKSADTGLQANAVELKQAGLYRAVVTRKPSVYTYVLDGDGKRQLRRGPKTAVTEGMIDTATRSVMAGTALIVVGKPGDETPKPVGLPVELTPLTGPSKWAANADLKFQILVGGKPVESLYPVVEARYVGFKPDNAWCYATTADRDGVATIRPDRAGTWVLKVNVKRPAPEASRSEFDTESFTATLTLEVRP